MTDTRRTLIQAQSWQAGCSVDVWIAQALFALMHPAGVSLALEEVEDGYICVLLHLGPDGLVPDPDLHLGRDNLQRWVEEKQGWDVTRSWRNACEPHLRAQRATAELEPITKQ